MDIVFGDSCIGVKDKDREYIFSLQTKGLESLKKRGVEWLFRSPKPTFWRATTDNDRGNGFSAKSSLWLGADMFINLVGFSLTVDETNLPLSSLIAPKNNELLNSPLRKADKVALTYNYQTVTSPSAYVNVTYIVSEGRLKTEFEYKGVEGLPELPLCGLRFIFPFPISSFDYTGLSGETYPDRMKGARRGTFHVVGMPVTQYLVPQDCAMHMSTSELVIKKGESELVINKWDDNFNFSLLPYTAEELENAYHQDELPPIRRSVLVIAAKVRGVGGINSWGAEPEKEYHISASGTYKTSFIIE